LHVGLNGIDPEHYAGWDGPLDWCEADATDMEELAQGRGFETRKLLTSEATAGAVLATIDSAAAELESGEIFLLTWAGHGGQVPDLNKEERDGADETWLTYDRQVLDDEVYARWGGFRRGVRIVVVSDSCHGGGATSARVGEVLHAVRTPDAAAAEPCPPYRVRQMPRDVALATYRANHDLYDAIQNALPSPDDSEVGATVLAFLGCRDYQFAREGPSNGLFTEKLLAVWNSGAWQGGYTDFHEAICSWMPPEQTPNYIRMGADNPGFEQQTPFTI
jgi:hypothetical protein